MNRILVALGLASLLSIAFFVNRTETQKPELLKVQRPSTAPNQKQQPSVAFDVNGDATSQAAAAIERRDFRLISDQSAVICFTPWNRLPESNSSEFGLGDMITTEMRRARVFADAYNKVIVEDQHYPYKDICRLRNQTDTAYRSRGDPSIAAQQISDPVRSLHEAVRRGSLDDVYHFLRVTPVGQIDGSGMTAAGWAAARGREEIYDALVLNGEPVWAKENYNTASGAYWAVATGRSRTLAKALAAPDAPGEIPAIFLETAVAADNLPAVELILSKPHQRMNNWTSDVLTASDQVVARVLATEAVRADDLLSLAAHGSGRSFRPELIRIALANGADPNGLPRRVGEYDPPLVAAARCYVPNSYEAVLALVGAGADVNTRSYDARAFAAIDEAIQSLKIVQSDRPSRPSDKEFQARGVQECHRVIDLLLRNGAKLNDVDKLGRRGAWRIFGGSAIDAYDFDTSGGATLPYLVSRGLDMNALWHGQTPRKAVEQRLGHDSAFATQLRAVGAK